MSRQPTPAGADQEDERSSLERRFSELVKRFWQTPQLPDGPPGRTKK